MNDSPIVRVREQLQFVKEILMGTVESNSLSLNRERVTVAIERISLIDELLSDVWQEVDRIRSEDEEIRQAHSLELAIQKEKSQRRDAGNARSSNHSAADLAVRNQKQLFPDQGMIDSYSDLARKHGELRRAIQLMQGEVESAIRNIDDFWTGDDEAKGVVIEKLRTVVTTNKSEI